MLDRVRRSLALRGTALTAALLLGAAAGIRAQDAPSLLEARKGFETSLLREDRDPEPLEPPPEELFALVRYPGPLGDMAAYVSQPADPGRKHPAIVWITGGFPAGGIGSSAWEGPELENEQSAQVYRLTGAVMMYPTLRGSFGNPGVQEGFYGEVDDVLAAIDYARGLDFVDPERVYLGGHSTGGTLALLVAAAATDGVRAVFAFGPVADPVGYGADALPYDPQDEQEARLRAPIHFLGAIRAPTYVIEGTEEPGNVGSLRELEEACTNDRVRFLPVEGADHFDVLAAANRVIAAKLVAPGGPGQIELTVDELNAAFRDQQAATLESQDLAALSAVRGAGVPLGPHEVRYYVLAREPAALKAAAEAAAGRGFAAGEVERRLDHQGASYALLVLTKRVTLRDLEAVFAASAAAADLAAEHGAYYNGWDVE